jgi:hypothetical protein
MSRPAVLFGSTCAPSIELYKLVQGCSDVRLVADFGFSLKTERGNLSGSSEFGSEVHILVLCCTTDAPSCQVAAKATGTPRRSSCAEIELSPAQAPPRRTIQKTSDEYADADSHLALSSWSKHLDL